jgi:hypothetical protein
MLYSFWELHIVRNFIHYVIIYLHYVLSIPMKIFVVKVSSKVLVFAFPAIYATFYESIEKCEYRVLLFLYMYDPCLLQYFYLVVTLLKWHVPFISWRKVSLNKQICSSHYLYCNFFQYCTLNSFTLRIALYTHKQTPDFDGLKIVQKWH